MLEFVADVTLHATPLILTLTSDADIEPVAAKFRPVNVNVCGPVIDDGVTAVKYGVTLRAHLNIHDPDEQPA